MINFPGDLIFNNLRGIRYYQKYPSDTGRRPGSRSDSSCSLSGDRDGRCESHRCARTREPEAACRSPCVSLKPIFTHFPRLSPVLTRWCKRTDVFWNWKGRKKWALDCLNFIGSTLPTNRDRVSTIVFFASVFPRCSTRSSVSRKVIRVIRTSYTGLLTKLRRTFVEFHKRKKLQERELMKLMKN